MYQTTIIGQLSKYPNISDLSYHRSYERDSVAPTRKQAQFLLVKHDELISIDKTLPNQKLCAFDGVARSGIRSNFGGLRQAMYFTLRGIMVKGDQRNASGGNFRIQGHCIQILCLDQEPERVPSG